MSISRASTGISRSLRAHSTLAPWLNGGCAAVAVILAGFATAATPVDAAEPLTVFTVNYPLAYFAERIGGDHVAVTFPSPAEGDPAFWNPDGDTIARYQAADLVLLNGAGYAKWAARASLRVSRTVDTSRGFEQAWIELEDVTAHTHGPEGEHSHSGLRLHDVARSRSRQSCKRSAIQAASGQEPGPRRCRTWKPGWQTLVADLEALDADLSADHRARSVRRLSYSRTRCTSTWSGATP